MAQENDTIGIERNLAFVFIGIALFHPIQKRIPANGGANLKNRFQECAGGWIGRKAGMGGTRRFLATEMRTS
jgi:hypothetical protein